MRVTVGDRLPDANLLKMGANGPEAVSLAGKLKGRKVVLFGLPGAFTGGCSRVHMPSFVRTAGAFAAKGVDEIICVPVNDPFVLAAWGKDTGADEAGIALLGDADCSFTKAIGMEFSAPQIGLIGRAVRYSMLVEDGVVTILNTENAAGVCELTAGENLLGQL